MKKNLLFPAALLFCLPAFSAPQGSGEDLLTGDKRLACEALLCLSSSTRPAECEPSIRKYFSIRHTRPGKTLSARKDFLRMCPSSDEKGMPELVNAIAEGAGRCDAASLNRHNTKRGFDGKDVIDSTLPEYCAAYAAHEYTAITLPRYVCSRRERDHDAWLVAALGHKPYDTSKDRCVSGHWQDVSADGK